MKNWPCTRAAVSDFENTVNEHLESAGVPEEVEPYCVELGLLAPAQALGHCLKRRRVFAAWEHPGFDSPQRARRGRPKPFDRQLSRSRSATQSCSGVWRPAAFATTAQSSLRSSWLCRSRLCKLCSGCGSRERTKPEWHRGTTRFLSQPLPASKLTHVRFTENGLTRTTTIQDSASAPLILKSQSSPGRIDLTSDETKNSTPPRSIRESSCSRGQRPSGPPREHG